MILLGADDGVCHAARPLYVRLDSGTKKTAIRGTRIVPALFSHSFTDSASYPATCYMQADDRHPLPPAMNGDWDRGSDCNDRKEIRRKEDGHMSMLLLGSELWSEASPEIPAGSTRTATSISLPSH